MPNGHQRTLLISLTALAVTALVTGAPATAAPASKPAPLRIVVTNDDGYAAPGIDALVEALRKLPRVKVTVVAPASNQSGTGSTRSTEPVTATDAETESGYPAIAVDGTPADSVVYALDELGGKAPHVVVSGINEGQNIGPAIPVSGTVGAALTAGREGVPALAASQGAGHGDPPAYPVAVRAAVKWVKEHRKVLANDDIATTEIASINAPTCPTGRPRGLVEVPPATTGDAGTASDCASTLEDPPDDVVAFANGYVTLSEIPTG